MKVERAIILCVERWELGGRSLLHPLVYKFLYVFRLSFPSQQRQDWRKIIIILWKFNTDCTILGKIKLHLSERDRVDIASKFY